MSPDRRLIRVDLPAPFGPMTAWISPTRTSSETSETASTPPKRFWSAIALNATSRAMSCMTDLFCPDAGLALRDGAQPGLGTQEGDELSRAAGQKEHYQDDG